MYYTNFLFDNKQKKTINFFMEFSLLIIILQQKLPILISIILLIFLSLNYKFWLMRCLKLVCNGYFKKDQIKN